MTTASNPSRRIPLLALVVLVVVIGGCAIYANLAFAVTDPSDYRFFPPFKPHVNENNNKVLGFEYFEIARALVAGRGFADPFGEETGPTAWMPPVLPAITAALLWVAGGDRDVVMAVVIALHALILIGTGWLILLLTRKAEARLGPWLTLAIFLVYVIADFRAWFQVTRDSWLILLTVNLLIAGLCWRQPLAPRSSALGWGLFGGLCALVNPIVGFTWGVMSFVIAWREHAWSRLALAGLVAALAVAPWMIRNYLLFGRLIPIKSNLAYELYQSQCLSTDGLLQRQTFRMQPHGVRKRQEYKALGETAFLDLKREQFWHAVRADPADFLERLAARLLAATLWYEPFDRSAEAERPWLLFTSRLIHPVPFLAIVVLLVVAPRARPGEDDGNTLCRLQGAVIGVYLAYLLPYIVVSCYDRYALPLLGVKVMLVVLAADRLVNRARLVRS